MLAALAACGDPATAPVTGDATVTGTGALVYAEEGTGHVMRLDLQTEVRTVVDPGEFGALAVSPDRTYVSYLGADQIPKVADLAGHVTAVDTQPTGCWGAMTWYAGGAFSYCTVRGTVFRASLDAPERLIDGPVIVASGHTIYRDGTDLVIDALDGSDRRVLRSNLHGSPITLTPDGARVLVADGSLLGVALADGATTDYGTAGLPGTIAGASLFSPDGRTVIASTVTALVAVDLETRATRTLATFDSPIRQLEVAWLDPTHVILHRQDDLTPPGSDVGVTRDSIWVTDGTPLQWAVGLENTLCQVAAVAPSQGLVATMCGQPSLLDVHGTVLAIDHRAWDTIGITGDGRMVSIGSSGSVTMVGADGGTRMLAVVPTSGTPLVGPFAVYAP